MENLGVEGIKLMFSYGITGVMLGYYVFKDYTTTKAQRVATEKQNQIMAVQNTILNNLIDTVQRLEDKIIEKVK